MLNTIYLHKYYAYTYHKVPNNLYKYTLYISRNLYQVPLDTIDNERKGSIHWASESQADKSSKCIQLLYKALPSLLELTDQQGRTPFHISAMSGNSKNMAMLVNLGCNVQATDNNQCTALHWAAGKVCV